MLMIAKLGECVNPHAETSPLAIVNPSRTVPLPTGWRAIDSSFVTSKRLLTLTLDPSTSPPADKCVPHIRRVWAKFRIYLARREEKRTRRAGKTITFISLLEFQKSGYPHLHILIDRYIPQRWIRASWNAPAAVRSLTFDEYVTCTV
jgi:hypothetical protein